MDIDRIIKIFRDLREEGVPTMNTASTAGKAGFGGSAQGFDPGPTAGYDKPIPDGRSRIMRRLPMFYKKDLLKGKKKRKKK